MKLNRLSLLYVTILLSIISVFTLSCKNTVSVNASPETVDVFYISSENVEYYNKVTFEKGHKLLSKEIPVLSSSDTHYFDNWIDEYGNNVSEGYIVNKNNYFFATWIQTKVEPVCFSIDNSFVDYNEEITLSTDTKDAQIYYTTDGTTLTSGSTFYTEPIVLFSEGKNLSETVTIKSIAIKDNLLPSDIVEHKYSMKTYTVTFDNKGYGSNVEAISNLKKGDKVLVTDLDDDTSVTPNKLFISWVSNNIPVKEYITITDNVNLEAIWTEYKQIENVQFSKNGNIDYLDEVELSCPIPGVDIYYTTDGSDPSDINNFNRNLYTYPIMIYESVKTIKAYATHKKLPQSEVSEASYIIYYNITYVLNSDSFNIVNNNPMKYTVEDEIILKVPVKSGWEAQWYDNENFYGDIVTNIPKGSTGNKTFYAKWTDLPPSEITNLVAKPGNSKITLSWDNPGEEDLSKVIITYDTNNTLEVDVSPNTSTTQEITSLTNDTEYTFNIKTVDKQGKESYVTSITATPIPVYDYTETPRVVDTQIINGTTYDIVEFGDWPQTVYSGDTTVLKPCDSINAWNDCYRDNNGNFYVKVTASPYESSYTYSDGTAIIEGQDYYFKVEPIQWRVLTNDYNGKKLLLAEKALAAYWYHAKSNKCDTSEIRAYLNGMGTCENLGFLQKAFTPEQIKAIADTEVDNSALSTTDAGNNITQATYYVCGNTTDKIFLLSEKEVTTTGYGFDVYGARDTTRQRTPTDYAKATGIYVDSTYGTCWWWLRSPIYSYSYGARDVSSSGYAHYDYYVYGAYGGVVPALSISF